MRVPKPVVIMAAGAIALGVGAATFVITSQWFGKPGVQFAGFAALVAGTAVFWLADLTGITAHEYSPPGVLFEPERTQTPVDSSATVGIEPVRSAGIDLPLLADFREMLGLSKGMGATADDESD